MLLPHLWWVVGGAKGGSLRIRVWSFGVGGSAFRDWGIEVGSGWLLDRW